MIDIEHRVTVAKLRELLSQLKDDDLLLPNMVQNLTIIRDEKYVGYIDLLNVDPHVEMFEEKEE